MTTKTLLTLAAASMLTASSLSSCIMLNFGGNNNTSSGSEAQRELNDAKLREGKKAMSPNLGGKLFTSAWMQRSAEYKALCQQAYNVATERLLAATAQPLGVGAKRWAIVTDIDETIIDNSPNSVYQALRGQDYSQSSWDRWVEQADAVALAGAVDFFRLAAERGVDIYYISNRIEINREGTKRNLKALGFPQVDDAHFMFKDKTSDKTTRRNEVLKTHNILMMLGDNLGDFDHYFDVHDEAKRNEGVKRFSSEFGRRFIVLPNPNYGTWEPAMYGGYVKLSDKDAKLIKQVRSHR